MRGAVVQNLFAKMTDQMLLEGKSPQEIMDSLMNSIEYIPNKAKRNSPQQMIDSKVEERINSLLLEDNSRDRER